MTLPILESRLFIPQRAPKFIPYTVRDWSKLRSVLRRLHRDSAAGTASFGGSFVVALASRENLGKERVVPNQIYHRGQSVRPQGVDERNR